MSKLNKKILHTFSENSATLFRCDSSSEIGLGHIMRDLVFASRLQNAEIFFATQNLEGNINRKIEAAGFTLLPLQDNSFESLAEYIEKYNIETLIIDHYGIDYTFEKKVKEYYPHLQLYAFDDTYKKHYVDYIINHNLGAKASRYACEEFCEVQLIEPLIRQEFYTVKQKHYKKEGVFISLGGSDPQGVMLKVLPFLRNEVVHIYTTSSNRHLATLKRFTKMHKKMHLHIDEESAFGMAKSRWGIVSASVSSAEALFLQLPIIALQTAENQKEVANYLKQKRVSVLDVKKLYKLKRKRKIRGFRVA